MSRTGSTRTIVSGGAVVGAGVAALPNTAGHSLGTILAITAIAIGVTALISQLVVRILRRRYTQA
ncbi:MAG TPA: hypothetical protein VFZ48_02575 [Candidatus Saccharimonadales bacterium]